MLARQYRYSFKKELPKNILSTPFFTMRYGTSSVYRMQCAVVVSKKINKKAVGRNKLKRRFLHALASVLHNVSNNYAIIFFLKKESEDKTLPELEQEIQNAFKRSTII